jgi:hypothetical protein
VKTLLSTIHVAFVGCHGNLIYRVVSWIPVLGNLWEVPVEGSHTVKIVTSLRFNYYYLIIGIFNTFYISIEFECKYRAQNNFHF